MITLLIMVLAFVSITLFVIVLFPRSLLTKRSEEDAASGGFIYQIKPILSSIAVINSKLEMSSYKANLEQKLTSAGDPFGEKLTPDEFIAFSQLCAGTAALIFGFLFGYSLTTVFLWGIFGYILSYFWIKDAAKKRQFSIQKQLPDFLDQLTLTVEAGLDFAAALVKILKASRKTPLTDEFRLMMQEIKLGATRHQSMKAMAARINIPDFGAFISSLVQTDKLGSSLGPTLRIQSDQMRIRRIQLAEKAGAEASVKLLVPLILFILPAVFIMIFGPIIIQFLSGSLGF